MKRRDFVCMSLGSGLLAPARAGESLLWRRRDWLGFGTTLSLRAGHENPDRLERALDAAVQAVRRIEAQMSLFDPDSSLSRLNRTGRLDGVPPDLMAVLRLGQQVAHQSSGAFDVTVQPLWLLFDQARRESRLPRDNEVAAAREKVGWQGLRLSRHDAAFSKPGMAATLNGIAQGYACDRVREVLRGEGIRHAWIDTGELGPLGRNPEATPWRLGLADPRDDHRLLAALLADGRCVATSADEPSSFSADHRHHHIFDPASGYSPTGLASVTVAAPSGALADALTKVFFVGGAERASPIAQRWGVDALWVDKQGRIGATAGLRWHLQR